MRKPPILKSPRLFQMEIPGGAKKLGLYSLLIFLALLICINIGLTLWLLSSLHFHLVGGWWVDSMQFYCDCYVQDGTGPVQFVKNGLKIDGATYIMDTLNTNQVRKSSFIDSP